MVASKKRFGTTLVQWRPGCVASALGLALALFFALVSHPVNAEKPDYLKSQAGALPAAGVPIIIYASRADCRFCRLLEKEVLKPLFLSGDYAGQFTLLPLALDEPQSLVDFASTKISAGALAARYQLQLTPTLVFVDNNGTELVPRLAGYQSGSFYEHYLEQAIRAAGIRASTQLREDADR